MNQHFCIQRWGFGYVKTNQSKKSFAMFGRTLLHVPPGQRNKNIIFTCDRWWHQLENRIISIQLLCFHENRQSAIIVAHLMAPSL